MARNSGRTSGGTAGPPSRGKSEGVNYNEEQYYAQNATYHQAAATQHATSSANISRQSSRQGGSASTNGGHYDQAYAGSVNYQHPTGTLDPRFLQQQQPQQQQVYAAPRRTSLSYPHQPDNAGIKDEEEDEEEDGDGDGDYEEPEDDDGEYGAAPSRSTTFNKGKGKATVVVKGKGKTGKVSNGSSNNKKRSSNPYKMEEDEEDEEDDYVEDDGDEEEAGSYEEEEDASEEDVPIQQMQSRNSPRASAAAAVPVAAPVQVHPNFIPLSQMQVQHHLPPSNRRVNIRFSNGQRTATQSTIAGPSHLQDAVSEADSQMTASSDAPHVTSNGQTYEAKYTAPTTASNNRRKRVIFSENEEEEEDAEGESELPPSDAPTVIANNIYAPSSLNDLPDIPPQVIVQEYKTHSGRRTLRKTLIESPGSSEDEETLGGKRRRGQSKQAKKYAGENCDDGEGDYKDNKAEGDEYMNDKRSIRKLRNARLNSLAAAKRNGGRTTRSTARWDGDDDEDYEEPDNNSRRGNGRRYSTESSDEEDGAPQFSDHTSDDDIMLAAKRGKEQDKNDRGYGLRRTNKVNYNLPTLFGLNPDGTAKAGPSNETSQSNGKDKVKKKKSGYGGPSQHLPFNMSGRQLGNLFGEAPIDSSSDDDAATPRRGSASYGGTSGGAMSAGGGAGSMDFGYSGTPNNLGKVSGATSKFRS